ncbi:MAG TPA: phosphoglycerate mutase family protein [Longimicrobiales bacterium]
MRLLVVRHARAESAKAFAETGMDDDLRPLTDDGRERMRQGAAGLHRLVDEIDILATSPLVRARQTAEIIAAEYGGLSALEVDELRPRGSPADLAGWLRDAGAQETIAIVGHETQLQELVGWLLTGRKDAIVEIKKGGAVMLEVHVRGDHAVKAGSATLLWSLAPRQLRLLGG